MMRTATKAVLVTVGLLVLAVVALTVAVNRSDGGAEALDPATGLPTDEASTARLNQQMAQRRTDMAAQGGLPVLLPEDQRAGWITAWNRMRDCTRDHGFDGVTAVQPGYGDGVTPGPLIVGGGEAAEAAVRACQFDTSLFDEEKVKAAVKASSEQRKRSASTSP